MATKKKDVRAKWTRPLAEALGWQPNKLRLWLTERGCPQPFDQALALKLLEDAGISTKKFKPTHDALPLFPVAPSSSSVPTESSAVPTPDAAPSTAVVVARAGAVKKRNAWNMKLIPRLARLLPEGDSPSGKKKVRQLLKLHGISKHDEPGALEVFKSRGIPIESFEYESATSAPARIDTTRYIAPPSKDPAALAIQYGKLAERLLAALERNDTLLASFKERNEIYKGVRHTLLQFETAYEKEWGGRRMPGPGTKPLNFIWDALAECRDHP